METRLSLSRPEIFASFTRDLPCSCFLPSNNDDLSEALEYMQSGEEQPSQKCIMKVFIVLDYEGPDLSQTASSLSGRTRDSSSRWPGFAMSEASSTSVRRGFDYRSDPSGTASHSLLAQNDDYQYVETQRERNIGINQGQDFRPGLVSRESQEDLRTFRDLSEGILGSTLDDRPEMEARWLSECMRSSTVNREEPGSRASTHDKYDTLATFREEELNKLNSIVGLPDSSASPRCCACAQEMVDLRFVCMACGPSKNSTLSSPSGQLADRREYEDNHNETSDVHNDQSGYEICEACVEIYGSQHAQLQGSPASHVYVEAHRSLDSRAWRVVGMWTSIQIVCLRLHSTV